MKKTLLFLLALCGVIFASPLPLFADKPTAEQVKMIKGTSIHQDKTRSVVEEVEVWLDRENETIEMLFNVELGSLTITIQDSFGNVCYSGTVDTNVTSAIQIQAPTNVGVYTINIAGANYIGYGSFII